MIICSIMQYASNLGRPSTTAVLPGCCAMNAPGAYHDCSQGSEHAGLCGRSQGPKCTSGGHPVAWNPPEGCVGPKCPSPRKSCTACTHCIIIRNKKNLLHVLMSKKRSFGWHYGHPSFLFIFHMWTHSNYCGAANPRIGLLLQLILMSSHATVLLAGWWRGTRLLSSQFQTLEWHSRGHLSRAHCMAVGRAGIMQNDGTWWNRRLDSMGQTISNNTCLVNVSCMARWLLLIQKHELSIATAMVTLKSICAFSGLSWWWAKRVEYDWNILEPCWSTTG